jgi:amino acid transporter
MTALVANCIIGGGILGLPGELSRLLGRASPLAMILAGLMIACFAEVASQFRDVAVVTGSLSLVEDRGE